MSVRRTCVKAVFQNRISCIMMDSKRQLKIGPCPKLLIRASQLFLIMIISILFSGCLSMPFELVKFPGRWTGWLSIGENETGYNTTIIKNDRYCTIHGEISGNKLGWGDFKMFVDGEGYLLLGGDLIGEVEIMVIYNNNADTLVTDGEWGGKYDQEIPVGWGSWNSLPNGKFSGDGRWMVQKENSVDATLNLLGY